MAKHEFAQRISYANGHKIYVGLVDDIGYISIEDTNLYPETDSRCVRRDMGFNYLMIPCMKREQLKALHTAIGEVLKTSK